MTSVEFAKAIGVSGTLLFKWRQKGILMPIWISPTGRCFYSEEQVEKYKNGDYAVKSESEFLSIKEFSKEIGVPVGTLDFWEETGRLKPDHYDEHGHRKYTKEQVEKYYNGDYDGIQEEGFINRERLARLIGVSQATLANWNKKGWLCPDHKSVTRIWQYRPDQVGEAMRVKIRNKVEVKL